MKTETLKRHIMKVCFFVFGLLCMLNPSANAQITKLTLDFTKPGVSVSPMLYGLMTEEINHSYDGGLYAELIRNRIFKDNKTKPEGWSLVQQDTTSKASIKLIAADPDNVPFDERRNSINGALTTCLRLTVTKDGSKAGIANEGYWGIPVKPATTYKASFYLKGTGSTPPRRFGPQGAAPATVPQHLGGGFTGRRLAVERRRLALALSSIGRAIDLRNHRKCGHARPGALPQRAGKTARGWHRAVGGRFRHGLLVTGAPQAATGARTENRPVVYP